METVLAGFVWTGGQTGGEKFLFCNKNGYVDWALLGDVNENYEKTIGLAWQWNNNFARTSLIFEHFFAVTAQPRRENT